MCLGGGSVPQAPNTSAQSGASNSIGQAGQQAGADQLNWAKGQVGQNNQTTQNVQGQLNPLIGQQAGAGTAATNQFQNTTIPGLNQQLQTAQNYGSPAGMAQASAAAQAQTGQAYNAARLNNQRQLGSYGVDPSQMKSGALNLNANLQQAGAQGNAGYNAGQQRQLTGMGLTSQALGQNLQAAGMGQGYTSGANATGSNIVGLGNQTTATGSSALSAPSQMMQTGLSGYGQSANIQNQAFQNQMASYNASQAGSNSLMSGLGSVAGIAAMAMMADGGMIPGRRTPGAYCNGGMYADGGQAMINVARGDAQSSPRPDVAADQATSDRLSSPNHRLPVTKTPMTSQGIPGRAYADGGQSRGAAMVPVSGIPQIQQGAQFDDPNAGGFGQGFGQGAKQAAPMAMSGETPLNQYRANAMLPGTNAMMNASENAAPQAQMAAPTFNMPGYANGGVIPGKQMDYGNPAVNPSYGVPPQVGIPGPWVAANGGQPPGLVDQGASDGTGIDDQVPAHISVGEYVVPADVVHAKGKEFFDKLLQRYHTPAQQQRQQMGMH